MGRRSLAEQLLEPYLEEEPGTDTWLVLYDFQGVKPPTKLYDNINRLNNQIPGSLIQYSVYMTQDQRAAKTMRDLVGHYDGQVTMFRGTLVE